MNRIAYFYGDDPARPSRTSVEKLYDELPTAFREPAVRPPFRPTGLPMRFEGGRLPVARFKVSYVLAEFARVFFVIGLYAVGWFAITILGLAFISEALGWSGGPPKVSRLALLALLIAGTIGALSWSIRRLAVINRQAQPARPRVRAASPKSGRLSPLYDRDLDGGF